MPAPGIFFILSHLKIITHTLHYDATINKHPSSISSPIYRFISPCNVAIKNRKWLTLSPLPAVKLNLKVESAKRVGINRHTYTTEHFPM